MNHKTIAADIADALTADPSLWCQGAFGRGPACCLLQHVIALCDDDGFVIDEFRNSLSEIVGVGSITYWNDWPGRTVEQVIDACRRIAA